jgi:hypothetical protein
MSLDPSLIRSGRAFAESVLLSGPVVCVSVTGLPGVPPALAAVVRNYVVLFPALDVSSAFPINGITLVSAH